jgi:glycosidase
MIGAMDAQALERRIGRRLQTLYGEVEGERVLRELRRRLGRDGMRPRGEGPRRLRFSERDAVLITYGDSLRRPPDAPLAALRDFARAQLKGVFSTIHLLPFFPSSSDDGFSVIDYHAVDPALGSWADVEALGREFKLVFDLVLNHVSRGSPWFAGYLAGEAPFARLAIEVDPGADLGGVTRPRALPLLTPYSRADGSTVHLWTTFSADQVDLDYRSPEVLLLMLEVVLHYLRRGSAMLRLDAVGYLWKELGTPCIHLPQTHEVVRLLRDVLDLVAPDVALLTETNVPHAENVSYFGDGEDEAQLVYNFSLPPLVLHALASGDAGLLGRWAATLRAPSAATTFLNFTASHDGVGVRPLEGLLPRDEIDALADLARRRGGRVSCRTAPDGSQLPYELNATYVDLLRGSDGPAGDRHHVARFLASQAIALCLPGVPAVYIGSLLGSRNWEEGVQLTGQPRSINRQKLDLDRVELELADPSGFRRQVFFGLRHLLQVRARQPALHPCAEVELLQLDRRCLALLRHNTDQRLLALTNVTDTALDLRLPELAASWTDALAGQGPTAGRLVLPPYGTAWLVDG